MFLEPNDLFMSPFPVAIIHNLVIIPKSIFGQQSSFVCKKGCNKCKPAKRWDKFWPHEMADLLIKYIAK